MITPIGQRGSSVRKHADWVFKYVMDACDPRGISLERADTMAGSPMITSRIFEAIRSADFCVADLTGLNANVFYELGVRHSLAKPVIHIAAEGTDLPFDNAQHDTIFFDLTSIDSMDGLTTAVGRQIDDIRSEGYVVTNPFTAALGAIALAQSADPRDQVIARLEERLSAIERAPALSGPTPSMGQLNALKTVLSRGGSNSKYSVAPALLKRAVDEIPPWEESVAQNLLWEVNAARGLTNSEELKGIILQKFPDLLPF